MKLKFYYPGRNFPSLSITGIYCELHCKHCNAYYLNHMIPVREPDELVQTALKLYSKGTNGFLLSGGCDRTGKVPLARFYGSLKTIKKKTDLRINVHTGFIDAKEVELLTNTGVDCISVDVIGSDKTIHEVIELNKNIEDYKILLKVLYRSELDVVPHICIGIHYGKLLGEFNAIELIKTIEPSAIVLNSLIPTKGTGMMKVQPPSHEDMLDVIKKTRVSFPTKPLLLGCMRVRKDDGFELKAINAGITGIVNPRKTTVEEARKRGYEIESIESCCAVR